MVLNASDPGYLRTLVEEARLATKRHLEHVNGALARYHGQYWKKGGTGEHWTPENTYYEYMTAMIPRLVYHNPRVRVSSRRMGAQTDVAESMQAGLNRVVKDLRLKYVLRDVALDMLFAYGVVLVKETQRDGLSLAEDDPMQPAKPTWPVAERIPPTKFFMDPMAYEWATTRYRGHEWRMDKEDLLARADANPDEGWNKDLIEILAVDIKDDLDTGQPTSADVSQAARKEIRAYDVWFPEIELDDSPGADEGFHGTVFTIAVHQSGSGGDSEAGMIRKPRSFYGPRTGPYTLYGVYKVPDSPYPLGPLMAVEGQIQELNVHARVSSKMMKDYKRMIGVRDAHVAEKIKNAPNDWVVSLDVEEVRNGVIPMEWGGLSEHTLNYISMLRERLNRLVGMDETMRGTAGMEDITATQSTLASESSQARIGEIKAAFANATTDVLETIGHYLYYSETTIFPISDQFLQDQGKQLPEWLGQDVQLWFRGGDHDRSAGYSFEDLELDIEPYSMERTSEGLQMQRMMQSHQLLMSTLPMMSQYPDFPWKEWFKQLGDSMNMPNLEELVRPEMLERLAKQLQMMMQVQAQPQMAAPQGPKFASQMTGSTPRPVREQSQASQGFGKPTAARAQGQGMPGNKAGASFGKIGAA